MTKSNKINLYVFVIVFVLSMIYLQQFKLGIDGDILISLFLGAGGIFFSSGAWLKVLEKDYKNYQYAQDVENEEYHRELGRRRARREKFF